MTTKQWIILAVAILVILLIAYGIKVSLDKQEQERKRLLYEQQLNNLNPTEVEKPPFLSQVLSVFTKLLVL